MPEIITSGRAANRVHYNLGTRDRQAQPENRQADRFTEQKSHPLGFTARVEPIDAHCPAIEPMERGSEFSLRTWRRGDIDALAHFANNRSIWINLRDRVPHPYTRADAEGWIASCETHVGKPMQFAIDLNTHAIGGVGIELLGDVHRTTAEIGYWLAEPYWGRGFATAAVIETTLYAFAEFPIERIQALVFEWNPASVRVLEKAGYLFEARQRGRRCARSGATFRRTSSNHGQEEFPRLMRNCWTLR